MSRHRNRCRAPRTIGRLVSAAIVASCGASAAWAQTTSVAGGTLALKSSGTATLGTSNGYVGTYLIVPAGGATVNFTINASASSGATPAPHMNLAIADTLAGFTVGSTSAMNYTTSNVTLPAGTYFVRNERDYAGNVGVSRSLTVNNLSVNTVSGAVSTFSNTSNNTNALAAANTYINNFRKGNATVALKGPGGIPLLAGTPVRVDLGRHAFNFGTAVAGFNGSTLLQNNPTPGGNNYNFQQALKANFNALVPENAGKWGSNTSAAGPTTSFDISYSNTILNYAQANNMRARMHNLIWGNQQPTWVNDMLANDPATLRNTYIPHRIGYYVGDATDGNPNDDPATKYTELDVYNESSHTPQYMNAYGAAGVASIYNDVAAAAASVGANVKLFTNEYNVLADSFGDEYSNWYRNHIQTIRNAGGAVGGVGVQYYANDTTATGAGAHSPARIMQVLQNLSTQGLPIALTEFGVKTSATQAHAAQVLADTMPLAFGTPNASGFFMWGFWQSQMWSEATAGAFYNANWTPTPVLTAYQNLMAQWNTDLTALADGGGAIAFNGFFGDYYLRGQTSGAFDLTLVKGTGNYNVNLAAPATWSLWNVSTSGNWGTAGSWSTGGVAAAAGQTAYFGQAAAARAVNVEAPRTVGMLAFNSTAAYSINGTSAITLQGFDNASGHRAAVYVAAGNHVINAPLTLLDDTTITVTPAASSVTASNLQPTAHAITKSGAGTFTVNRVHAAALGVDAGIVRVAPNGTSAGTSIVGSVNVAAGAVLDLTDNDLIVDYAGPSPEAVIRQRVKDGRVAGSTSGIFSTPGSPDDDKVLAVADNTAWGRSQFNGINIDGSTVVAKYTFFGDANLDGKVTGDDYLNVDANLGTGDTWLEGDFNMNGVTTGDDYLAIDANLGKGTPDPLAFAELKDQMVAAHVAMFGEEYLVKLAAAEAEGFGASVVPEPGLVGLLGAVGAASLRRRRKMLIGRRSSNSRM